MSNEPRSEGIVRRRTVVAGAAWAAPVIVAVAAAPSFAASAGVLDIRFFSSSGCVDSNGIGDVYAYVNIQNNTSSAITLSSPLVFRVVSTNPDRSHTAPSTSYGTITCNSADSMTMCDDFTWTIPSGTVIAAGGQVDMVIHLLSDLGYPTSLTVTETSTPRRTSNSGANSVTQGYTGPNGCVSYAQY